MFLDVHSHIVPSGDDGVGDVEEGLALAREAARRGTSVLYGTPHVWPQLPLHDTRERAIREAHASMAARLREDGLDLRLGFEVTPSPQLLEDDLARYRLEGLDAALIEVPFAGPVGLLERIAEEMELAGITPILGHPERADAVGDDPGILGEWVERGWRLQVNATSLLGRHGTRRSETAWLLVERGDAHLVASDGHRPTRPPFLDEAYTAVRDRIGERADALFDGSALAELAARGRADLAQRR